ncbi:MAG: ferritin-like domain-containing protein [Clostridia bacterium]|nr:ferritin-like domain-containing protein [Clostridia bacterium]
MVLTEKETSLLKDMKSQEELCIKKYTKYASEAKCEKLKELFNSIANKEREHLKTIVEISEGKEPKAPSGVCATNDLCIACSYQNTEDKDSDCFLLSDMLTTEKQVSSLYNTSVFEFTQPPLRKMLSHIQSEEQQHGEWLYAFMKANGMYN